MIKGSIHGFTAQQAIGKVKEAVGKVTGGCWKARERPTRLVAKSATPSAVSKTLFAVSTSLGGHADREGTGACKYAEKVWLVSRADRAQSFLTIAPES